MKSLKLLMIDNYDSFVYNLVRYFEELNISIDILRNDHPDLQSKDLRCYDGIVLSPGPKSPTEAGLCLDVIERYRGRVPILGICLGHQCIGHVFGASVVKGKRPYHGKVTEISHNGTGLFKNIPSPIAVTRYHSLVVENLPETLEVTAVAEDNVIMGMCHKDYPLHSVQFHPEAALTEKGHALLKNFLEICQTYAV